VKQLLRRWSHWWRTSESVPAQWLRAAHSALLGEMPILAAGTALFALVALIPAIAAAVAIYGLVGDPTKIHGALSGLVHVLPVEVVRFIGDQLERQAQRSSGELGLQLAFSIALAVFSARSSARALIDSLNRAYRVRELRKPFKKMLVALSMAGATLGGLMLVLVALVALPALVGAINRGWISVAMIVRWPVLLAVVFLALLALYRYAPSPRPLGESPHICLPGAIIGTLLLVIVSWALSLWVDNIANAELIYGAFGSVIVTLLWFYFSTMALVIGGFVNAELERHAGAPEPDRSMY
jgi:membrane protein